MRKEDACGGREKERRQDGSRGTSYGITARLCAGYKDGSDSRMILRRLRSTDLSHPATAIIFSAVTYENIRRDSTYIVCPSSLRAACSISVRCGLADSCWLCVRCLLHNGAVLAASASRIRLVRKAR